MIRKVTLSIFLLLALFTSANAQRCGENTIDAHKGDTTFARGFAKYVSSWVSFKRAHELALSRTALSGGVGPQVVYQIPVVVHIIDTGEVANDGYNPSDAAVDTMIARLNRMYATQYSGFPDSSSGGAFIPFQFVLAQRDSACNTTSGITRTNGSSVAGFKKGGIALGGGSCVTCAVEASVKALNFWPVDEYLNIWVVSKIDSTDGYSALSSYVAGYAYIPFGSGGGNPTTLDGVVMLAQQVAQTGPGVTVTHELGHSMGLLHVFQNATTTSCPSVIDTAGGPNNCATNNDLVCDTEPEKQSNFNCPSDPNPCTGRSYFGTQHNIMDYSNCQDRFTKGQRQRMLFTLTNTDYSPGYNRPRVGLIGSLGGTAPAALTALSGSCTPTGVTTGGTNAGVYEFKISDTAANTYGYLNEYLDFVSHGTSDDGGYYIDRSCRQGAFLIAGNTYNFLVETGTRTEKARVYIDFNNDGSFDATELVFSHDATKANERDSVNFQIPTSTSRPTLVTCTPLRMRVISDDAATISPCSATLAHGQVEDYMVEIKGTGVAGGSVINSLVKGSNPSCAGDTLTFAAIPTGATSPVYKWYVNGTYTGVTTDSFATSSVLNGDIVTVKMIYASGCGNDSAISNAITISRVSSGSLKPSVKISLTFGNNPGCAGDSAGFTAYPTNGGSSPIYQWKVNGINVGTSINSYGAYLKAGDIVTCVMTSNSACASPKVATSNSITISNYHLVANVTIAANKIPVCQGRPEVFNSTLVNTGKSATFQWFKNSTALTGETGVSYITSTLVNGDKIFMVMTAPDSCIINHIDTSNVITVTVDSSYQGLVGDSVVSGNNPGCLDSLITFGSRMSNLGLAPHGVWLVNGVQVGTGSTYSSTTLQNGDTVVYRANQTDGQCYLQDTVYGKPIIMQLSPTPPPPFISLIGDMLVSDVPGTLVWYGPSGKISGTSGQTCHPTQEGNYYATLSNNGCQSKPSNILNLSLLNVTSYNLSQVKIYPNPTTGKVNLDWNGQTVNMKVDVYTALGQGIMHDEIHGSSKVIDLSILADGNYFIVLRSPDGSVGTITVTLRK